MKKTLTQLCKFSLPEAKEERWVFRIAWIAYALLGIFLSLRTNIIAGENFTYNLYFGYDAQIFVQKFFAHDSTSHLMDSSHPFFRLMMIPVILLASLCNVLLGVKAKTLFLLLLTNTLVSASLMLIYRYLRSLLRLTLGRSSMLVIITGFFSTYIILSFTPESYPVSLYLLTFLFVYYSFSIQEKRVISIAEFVILTLLTCGTTITNGVKCFIPELYTGLSLKEKFSRILKASLIILGIYIAYHILLIPAMSLLKGELYLPWNNAINALSKYSTYEYYPDVIHADWWDMALSYFFGAPILFSSILITTHESGIMQMLTGTYDLLWQYIWVIIMLVSLVLSFVRNHKNCLVQMLVLAFLVDILIHLVLNYGIYEAFIYGGHWVFIVPMLWGWLYHGIRNKTGLRILDVSFLVIGLALIINNIQRMLEFVQFSLQNYPA